MIKLDKIMLPTDFSSNSKTAQMYACAMAKQFNSELHIVHIIIDPALMMPPMEGAYIPQGYRTEMKERSDKELAELPPADMAGDLTIVRATVEGVAHREITRYANDQDIDMIIMATHGHSGFSAFLLGSVTEKVVRNAPCAVLTVHSDDHLFIQADAD